MVSGSRVKVTVTAATFRVSVVIDRAVGTTFMLLDTHFYIRITRVLRVTMRKRLKAETCIAKTITRKESSAL